jgi:hypothetical protein
MKTKNSLDRNTFGLLLIIVGLLFGCSAFGWIFTLNDICIVTGLIGIILIFLGVFIIK